MTYKLFVNCSGIQTVFYFNPEDFSKMLLQIRIELLFLMSIKTIHGQYVVKEIHLKKMNKYEYRISCRTRGREQ